MPMSPSVGLRETPTQKIGGAQRRGCIVIPFIGVCAIVGILVLLLCCPSHAQTSATIGTPDAELAEKWGKGVPDVGAYFAATLYKNNTIRVSPDHCFYIDIHRLGLSLTQAQVYAKKMIPNDAALVHRQKTGRDVDFFYSRWLDKRTTNDDTYVFNKAKRGTFFVIYTRALANKNNISGLVIAPGTVLEKYIEELNL